MKTMNKDINQYFSKVAKNLKPYTWEEPLLENSLRFDTNTLPYPPRSLTTFLKVMGDNCPINEYTDPKYKRLKNLVASYEGVKPDMITITNSGDEAIDVLAKTFLDAGDLFIVTPPTYEMFTIQSTINGGRPLKIPLAKETFMVNAGKIIETTKKQKVKLIFLGNPNNPTASIIPPSTIEKIVRDSQSIVVVDEVYREFYGKSAISLLGQYPNLVILRSFSKFAALAGARIGYLVARESLSEKFDCLRFPMGVSFFSYKLAEIVLENRDWIKQTVAMINQERERLSKKLQQFGFTVYPSYANFILVKIGNRAREICDQLKRRGMLIRDRSSKKYLEGCVRITVRSPKENNQLLEGIKEILYES